MRPQLSDNLKEALQSKAIMPETLEIRGVTYNLHESRRAGYKGVVWKVTDDIGRFRALKLTIHSDYEDRSWAEEVLLASRIEREVAFARLDAAELKKIDVGEFGSHQFVCFISDWIEGLTLNEHLLSQPISSRFLFSFGIQMSKALSVLKAQKLRHDDLHANNVMIERKKIDDESSVRIVIVDNGSLKEYDAGTKRKDDHRNFVEHLVALHNCMFKRKALSSHDRRFLHEISILVAKMLDDDNNVALRDPAQIEEQFQEAYKRATLSQGHKRDQLQNPFEYISAEHLADDELLVQIFAKSCPWLHRVSGRDPVVLTGPRGCGKSTIFRWLSLRAHLHRQEENFEQFHIAGFYLSCSTDLQNRFSWVASESVAERFKKEIIHYFNLLLVREVLATVVIIGTSRPDKEILFGLTPGVEKQIQHFILSSIDRSSELLEGVSRIRQALELIEDELRRTHTILLRGENLANPTSESFLGDFTAMLVSQLPFFESHKIAFLIDDFSIHRIPREVQVVLNRVIHERRPTHIFKISSEKYGADLNDSFLVTAESAREFVEVDAGMEYLGLNEPGRKLGIAFVSELLDNRLKAAEFQGTALSLLGTSKWPEGSLAKSFRLNRSQTFYHGVECIADICSGDVSTVLLLFRRIFEKGDVNASTITMVKPTIQNDAIVEVSRNMLEGLRAHFPYGKEMFKVANAFGNLVRNILDHGRLQPDGDPPQCPRIEVDDTPAVEEKLNHEESDLAKHLISRSVFIELALGSSQHSNVTTVRWNFRRVYLPSFGAALSKSQPIRWSPEFFKLFLTSPEKVCTVELNKRREGDVTAQEEIF